jgi:hypothetical protein
MIHKVKLFVVITCEDSSFSAVHCLNALLQGAHYSELELLRIARELDDKDKQLMMVLVNSFKHVRN